MKDTTKAKIMQGCYAIPFILLILGCLALMGYNIGRGILGAILPINGPTCNGQPMGIGEICTVTTNGFSHDYGYQQQLINQQNDQIFQRVFLGLIVLGILLLTLWIIKKSREKKHV